MDRRNGQVSHYALEIKLLCSYYLHLHSSWCLLSKYIYWWSTKYLTGFECINYTTLVPMKWKIIAAYSKGFSKKEWRFPFWNIFFRFRNTDVFVLCKLEKWWRHEVCNLNGGIVNKEYLIIQKTSISLKRTKIFQKGKHHFLEKPIKKATIIFHFTGTLICNNTEVTDLTQHDQHDHNQHDISVLNTWFKWGNAFLLILSRG